MKTQQAVSALIVIGMWSGWLNTKQAQAHRRDFPFTYDWMQPSKGEKEFEPQSLYRRGENSFEQQIELEYGVTNRFMISPYVVFEKETGGNLRYSGFKLESRYQLGNYKEGRILPGLYLEGEKPRDEKAEIETKLILSCYDKQGEDFSMNLIAEKSLEKGSDLLTTFSFGYARPIGQSKYNMRGGFEIIRDIDDKRVNAGPVFGMELNRNISFVAGYGFPLTHRDENKGEFRLLAEYEWF